VAGADHILDPSTTDIAAAVSELTKGRNADVTFECAGIDAVLKSAILSTRAGGTCVNVAIWGHEAKVALNDLVFREVKVLGSLAYANDHPATIGMVESGRVDPYQFITGRIRLDDIVTSGFDELVYNKGENVKILVRPQCGRAASSASRHEMPGDVPTGHFGMCVRGVSRRLTIRPWWRKRGSASDEVPWETGCPVGRREQRRGIR
jgi:hypothetical protein